MNAKFFDEQLEQSLVKATIVERYFRAWASLMEQVSKRRVEEPRIGYIDLFAGPGRYKDGAKSTPLRVIESAVSDPWLRRSLVALFNDKDEAAVKDLQAALDSLPGIETLKHRPEVRHGDVGDELVSSFASTRLIPTLYFVDPFGYKGLSLKLINSVLKDWGSEAIVFFNFNRINMGINNLMVEPHMQALFGEERIHTLRDEVAGLSPREREEAVINAVAAAMVDIAGRSIYVLPFRFLRGDGVRTSHYLIFATKSIKGLEMMKDVMARSSDADDDGVPYFEYSPGPSRQPGLFPERRIEQLAEQLSQHFAGRSIGFDEVFSDFEHSQLGTPYLRKHYRQALKVIEEAGGLDCTYSEPGKKRRRGTYSDKTTIHFPVLAAEPVA